MKTKNCFIFNVCLVLSFLISLCGCENIEKDTTIMRKKLTNDIQIRTDIEPIYNHFPTLPKTEKIEWCSISSKGIGLVTKELFVFAKYDTSEEIDEFLEDVTLLNGTSKIYSIFVPDFVEKNETWVKIKTDRAFFQKGIDKASLKYPEVYVNSQHNIIFFHAMFE